MKYSEAWPELEKRVRRIRKEAGEKAKSARRARINSMASYYEGRHDAAQGVLDLIDQLEWEFE